ncbi:MAG: hypothetical protein GF347_00615 [Candidatus Moranbacteria bacterium]|nr:hypothetical protein [Candidatus Moranbacteria bacterium]
MSEEFDLSKVMTPEFGAAMGQAIGKAVTNALADKGMLGQKATVTDPPPYNQIHGHGSLFGTPQVGIDREVISAMMTFRGLGSALPLEGVRTLEQFLPFITGVDETSSTERSTECGDCISGETEACVQHFPTGLICRETKSIKIQRAIERLNNGDIDLQLLNEQLGSDSPWHPGWSPSSANDIMQIYAAWALLFELPPLFANKLTPMVWTGNPTNNNGNAYREFRGLDLLINTGFVDAYTNTTCPALDSDVKDYNYQDVLTGSPRTFYEYLEMAHWYVYNNAEGQGLLPVEWAVVMRPALWQLVSSTIPVQSIVAALLNTTIPTSYQININGMDVLQERRQYRESMMIPLNGMNVPVILDHGITELNNATDANLNPGEYASDVYIVPMRYLGNREALKIQHKDYRFITEEIRATDGLLGNFYRPSPDGRFSWSLVTDGPCFKIQAEIEPRLLLKTPQLAARIQNVKYVPMQHIREPGFDSPYRFKGGVSTRGATYYYH